jgi:hypothetical protein
VNALKPSAPAVAWNVADFACGKPCSENSMLCAQCSNTCATGQPAVAMAWPLPMACTQRRASASVAKPDTGAAGPDSHSAAPPPTAARARPLAPASLKKVRRFMA